DTAVCPYTTLFRSAQMRHELIVGTRRCLVPESVEVIVAVEVQHIGFHPQIPPANKIRYEPIIVDVVAPAPRRVVCHDLMPCRVGFAHESVAHHADAASQIDPFIRIIVESNSGTDTIEFVSMEGVGVPHRILQHFHIRRRLTRHGVDLVVVEAKITRLVPPVSDHDIIPVAADCKYVDSAIHRARENELIVTSKSVEPDLVGLFDQELATVELLPIMLD